MCFEVKSCGTVKSVAWFVADPVQEFSDGGNSVSRKLSELPNKVPSDKYLTRRLSLKSLQLLERVSEKSLGMKSMISLFLRLFLWTVENMPDDVEVNLFVFWRIKTEEFEKVLVSTWPKYRGLPQVREGFRLGQPSYW